MFAGIAILILIAVAVFLKWRSNSSQEELYIAPASHSQERLKKLNMDGEDIAKSGILDESQLNLPAKQTKENEHDKEYKAQADLNWIVSIRTKDGQPMDGSELTQMFDLNWRQNFSSSVFGFEVSSNKWSYLDYNEHKLYPKIEVAVNLLDTFYRDNNSEKLQPSTLERYLTELTNRFSKSNYDVSIEPLETIASAITKAQNLITWNRNYNKDMLIILLPESDSFNGIEVWNTLTELGLTWGNMDLFHWNNSSDVGGDNHFSVWTATEPGYFLPEEIKRGSFNPDSLVFGYIIPQSVNPSAMYEILLQSARYCQQRLGGKLINQNNEHFDEIKEREALHRLITKMQAEEIEPGSSKALRTFW